MRKLALLLVVFSVAYLFSCNKNDFPDLKEACQIKLIDREPGPWLRGIFEYNYNEKRLLTKLIYSFARTSSLTFEYNNHGRLVLVRDSVPNVLNSYYKLFYQNGFVTQIDAYFPDLNIVQHGFFKYDNKGRLIEKRGLINSPLFGIAMARYEYKGNSRNPIRQLFFRPSGESGQEIESDPAIIREYKYDNKVNPQATLINMPLSPLIHGDDNVVSVQYFEVIPDNNVVYMKIIRNIEGVYYNFVESFFSYDYNGHFPTLQTMRAVQHYPDGRPDSELTAHTTMAYDCINR